MLVCDALQEFPTGRKGYLLYGNPGATQLVLRRHFPGARTLTSAEDAASAEPGMVLVPPDLSTFTLDYVEMPKTGRTYVFVFEEVEKKPIDSWLAEAKEKFSKLKLPQIDCTDPQTPKPKQSVVNFLMGALKLPEEAARMVAQRAEWDLAKIFHTAYRWQRVARGAVLKPSQVTNLVDTLLPLDPATMLVREVFANRFHRITPDLMAQADPTAVLERLSTDLDKLRIVSRVLSDSPDSLTRETGLSPTEIKYFVPLARQIKRARITQWGRILVWAYARKNQPGLLAALVAMLGR